MRVVVCVKWVDLRPEVDPLTGASTRDDRTSGWSAADLAAMETALALADGLDGAEVTAVSVGPPAAERGLRELLAAGAAHAVRIDATEPSSRATATMLAGVAVGADWVICGDYSADRGSGSVPAFLAHELGAAQALGLTRVESTSSLSLRVTRRLGGGRSEIVEIESPGVISVEGSVASLRRASLMAELAAADAPIEIRPAPVQASDVRVGERAPLRPRTRGVEVPSGDHALDRIVELTGAHADRTPPRTITAGPDEAAAAIVEQLRAWGYLGDDAS